MWCCFQKKGDKSKTRQTQSDSGSRSSSDPMERGTVVIRERNVCDLLRQSDMKRLESITTWCYTMYTSVSSFPKTYGNVCTTWWACLSFLPLWAYKRQSDVCRVLQATLVSTFHTFTDTALLVNYYVYDDNVPYYLYSPLQWHGSQFLGGHLPP